MRYAELKRFYEGKRVFVTGHTGFKGAWLCKMLRIFGAEVFGYSLEPPTTPSVFELLGLDKQIHSEIGDIRDYEKLLASMRGFQPDYVFHLAAQPLVRESYKTPRETFDTNVMGTVNLLECVRQVGCVKSVLNVTTDKVYENNDLENHAFREDEKLDGYDPYSNSKSCSELVTHSYIKSFFFGEDAPAVSTARAGNVIGGGDFAADRIIPDCVRASVKGQSVHIRNPYSTRPYQHVLEPLSVYLTIVMKQTEDRALAGYYNVGPDDEDCVSTGMLADLFVQYWEDGAQWVNLAEKNAPHEASFLKLDCAKLKSVFNWKPIWHVQDAVRETVSWYKAWNQNADMNKVTEEQIKAFLG